eukprot:1659041-Rhodomonas_salina.1
MVRPGPVGGMESVAADEVGAPSHSQMTWRAFLRFFIPSFSFVCVCHIILCSTGAAPFPDCLCVDAYKVGVGI